MTYKQRRRYLFANCYRKKSYKNLHTIISLIYRIYETDKIYLDFYRCKCGDHYHLTSKNIIKDYNVAA